MVDLPFVGSFFGKFVEPTHEIQRVCKDAKTKNRFLLSENLQQFFKSLRQVGVRLGSGQVAEKDVPCIASKDEACKALTSKSKS